jgi:hypothetical protein
MPDLKAQTWRVASRFALGAVLALGGTILTIVWLMQGHHQTTSSLGGDATVTVSGGGLSGPTRLTLVALISAAWFFAGGSLAGGTLRPARRGRLGLGVAFLLAGVCLMIWLFGFSVGIGAPWDLFVMQGVGCAVIWTGAGLAGGLILRDDVTSLSAAITGFGIGGFAGGACLTAGLIAMAASAQPFARVVYALGLILAWVLPPVVAGAILGRSSLTHAANGA